MTTLRPKERPTQKRKKKSWALKVDEEEDGESRRYGDRDEKLTNSTIIKALSTKIKVQHLKAYSKVLFISFIGV